MEDSFSPRTVAIVALSSLVGGFVAVFGGWMLLHRAPPAPPPLTAPAPPPTAPPAVARVDASTAAEPGPEPAAEPNADAGAEPAAPVVTDGGTITIGPITVSRCWAAGSPAVTPGAACDRLPALDQHLASRAAQIAGCASGQGRLALVLDFRVSTNFARAVEHDRQRGRGGGLRAARDGAAAPHHDAAPVRPLHRERDLRVVTHPWRRANSAQNAASASTHAGSTAL